MTETEEYDAPPDYVWIVTRGGKPLVATESPEAAMQWAREHLDKATRDYRRRAYRWSPTHKLLARYPHAWRWTGYEIVPVKLI